MSMTRPARWLAVASLLSAGSLAAEPQDPPACRPHLVSCNIGDHYSGTFKRLSVVEYPGGKTTEDVAARVVRGKTSCEGSITSTDPSAETGPIRGDGLLAVEWGKGTEDDPEQPWYRIAVACPGVNGSPARMGGSEIDTYKQPRRTFSLLEGKSEEEHPETDEVNGVTGTVRLSWSLSRE